MEAITAFYRNYLEVIVQKRCVYVCVVINEGVNESGSDMGERYRFLA